MNRQRTLQLAIGGGGIAISAVLAAWMMPNTTPHRLDSPLAGMGGVAAAQKPTYSPIPDSLIPTWQPPPPVATRPPAPVAGEEAVALDGQDGGDASQLSSPLDPMDTASTDAAPPTPQVAAAPVAAATPPGPSDTASPSPSGYDQARAAWRAQMAAYRRASRAAAGSPDGY